MADTRDRKIPSGSDYRPRTARILNSRSISSSVTLLRLEMADGSPLGHLPGQFVQLSLYGYGEAPISICSSPTRKGSFELCIQAAGNLSRALQEISDGDWVGIRGPYGNGFPLDEVRGKNLLVVAAGLGYAPLRSLIQYVLDKRPEYGNLTVLHCSHFPSTLPFRQEAEKLVSAPGIDMRLTVSEVDVPWSGRVGSVISLLREADPGKATETAAFIVGPPRLYHFAILEILKKGIERDRIFLSLERRFKCGIGKCGHCQIDGKYVCQDGPVFRFSELTGLPEAIEIWAPEDD